MAKKLTLFLAGLFALVVVVGGLGLLAFVQWFGAIPLGGPQTHAEVDIKRGIGPQELARILVEKGVLAQEKRNQFYWYGRLSGQWKRLRAGEYELSGTQNALEVFDKIASGISLFVPITIREGENSYEIAADMEAKRLTTKAAFLGLIQNPAFVKKATHAIGFDRPEIKTLEGFLYPETYNFNRTMSAEDMIMAMVHLFGTKWTPPDADRAKELGFSPYEVVILASMIEKETGAPEERPLVSSIFHNRLKKHMKLQSDPTTIYGIWAKYTAQGNNIKREDLQSQTAYNTYFIPALPTAPIANPGQLALKAALYPQASTYLYFVSHNDGTHQFSSTLAEHNKAVKRFQVDPHAREGKSWRQLPKASPTQTPPIR